MFVGRGCQVIVSIITCNFMSCRGTSWYDEPKYIVYHDNLIELMKKCCKCGQPTSVDRVMRPSGCLVTFNITCLSRKCGHSKKWSNSPSRGRLPLLNILLVAVILFTGCLPTKILSAFRLPQHISHLSENLLLTPETVFTWCK